VDSGTKRATALRQPDVEMGTVVEDKHLTLSGPEKRHIEIKLPEGMHYNTGDYLAM
jgi:cytochrome P450 / NADPH-cytochrome P450 reductase